MAHGKWFTASICPNASDGTVMMKSSGFGMKKAVISGNTEKVTTAGISSQTNPGKKKDERNEERKNGKRNITVMAITAKVIMATNEGGGSPPIICVSFRHGYLIDKTRSFKLLAIPINPSALPWA
jgi:hypothetical protein